MRPFEPTRRRLLTVGGSLAGIYALPGSLRAAPIDPTIGRELVFDDNFTSIDWSVWNAGPKAGTADAGFYGRSAFARRGGEAGFDPYAIVDDLEATDRKALQISVKHIGKVMSVPQYYGNNLEEFQWVSGNLQTATRDGLVTRGWRKGYFEARMLFPRHPLTWPAFWLMNARSILAPQTSIELDVVEHKGFEPTIYGAYLHEWGQPGEHHEGTGVTTDVDMTKQYCNYGILVDDVKCVPYFNRKPVIDTRTGVPASWPISRSAQLDSDGDLFWPLLTLALRSDYAYPADMSEDLLSARMRIDWFRVYQ